MKRLFFGLEITIAVASVLFAGWMYHTKKEKMQEFCWENYKTTAHALGSLDGKAYLNARESFISSYERGQRMFEVDLSQTSDGKWICRHNWKEPLGQWKGKKKKVLTEEQFLAAPIYGKYTPMNLEDFFLLLKEYPDAYVMIDSKKYATRDYSMTLEDYRNYVETARAVGAEDVLRQIIPQIYNEDMLEATESLYNFTTYVYSLWQEYSVEELKRTADYCKEKGIPVVTVNKDFWTEEIQKIFDEKGILVCVYTVNDLETAKEFLEKGAAGICTDTLVDSDLEV